MLRLEIVTPEKRVIDADVDAVTLPTATGEIGVLPHHAALVTALKPGVLTYTVKGTATRLAVTGGFAEVNSDKVSVLADAAEASDLIDTAAARAAKEEAEKAIAALGNASVEDTEAARERLDAANVLLQVAAGK